MRNHKTENSAKIPELFKLPKSSKRQVIYVFQGGGALGAFQVGAYEALSEHDYHPNMVVGISIGAINSSIIAGNPPAKRLDQLYKFWNTITTKIPFPMLSNLGLSKFHHFISANNTLLNGQPGFFTPRPYNPWFLPDAEPDQLSFYDTTPLRETLSRLIDFNYLNNKGPRLCLGAVDLETGNFEFFDSKVEEITLDHILASCSLPPGFPPTMVNGRYYVDGGVYSNTPLSKVIDEFAESSNDIKNVLCFMVDLFSGHGVMPHSFDGLLEKIKDIQYSSHSKRATKMYATTQNLSHAINYLASRLPKEELNDPKIQEIIKLGFAHRMDVIRVIYKSEKGSELHSKDYEFSKESANVHRTMGYNHTMQLIKEQADEWNKRHSSGVTIYTMEQNKSSAFKL